MEQKNSKMSLVFQIIAFDVVAVNFHYHDEDIPDSE